MCMVVIFNEVYFGLPSKKGYPKDFTIAQFINPGYDPAWQSSALALMLYHGCSEIVPGSRLM